MDDPYFFVEGSDREVMLVENSGSLEGNANHTELR